MNYLKEAKFYWNWSKWEQYSDISGMLERKAKIGLEWILLRFSDNISLIIIMFHRNFWNKFENIIKINEHLYKPMLPEDCKLVSDPLLCWFWFIMGMGNGIGCPYIPNIGYPGNPPGYPGILPDSPELKSPLIKKMMWMIYGSQRYFLIQII